MEKSIRLNINRKFTLKAEWYTGIAFGFCFYNHSRDYDFTFILPFLAFELSVSKKAKVVNL